MFLRLCCWYIFAGDDAHVVPKLKTHAKGLFVNGTIFFYKKDDVFVFMWDEVGIVPCNC